EIKGEMGILRARPHESASVVADADMDARERHRGKARSIHPQLAAEHVDIECDCLLEVAAWQADVRQRIQLRWTNLVFRFVCCKGRHAILPFYSGGAMDRLAHRVSSRAQRGHEGSDG